MSPCHAHNRLSLPSQLSPIVFQGSPGPLIPGEESSKPLWRSHILVESRFGHWSCSLTRTRHFSIHVLDWFKDFSSVAPYALEASSLSPFPFSIDASKILGFYLQDWVISPSLVSQAPTVAVTGAFWPDGLAFTRPCKILETKVFKE